MQNHQMLNKRMNTCWREKGAKWGKTNEKRKRWRDFTMSLITSRENGNRVHDTHQFSSVVIIFIPQRKTFNVIAACKVTSTVCLLHFHISIAQHSKKKKKKVVFSH